MEKYNQIIDRLNQSDKFGRLTIDYRSPKKKRRQCDELARQVKAARAYFDTNLIEQQEQLVLLLLTDQQELITGYQLYTGTSNEIGMDYRQIIRVAALADAYYVITVHNHPDGYVQPSNADVDSASRMAHALRFAGFELLDSITITRKKHFSLGENGLLRA